MIKKKKIKPPTLRQYGKEKVAIALGFCPSIDPCKKCGWPVIDGFCCPTCGSANPYYTEQEEEERGLR